MNALKRSWIMAIVILSFLTDMGCSKDWRASTYPATGRVTINGEPPVGAIVQLLSTGEQADIRNSRPWAIVEKDGRYHLSTYKPGDGAPKGEYFFTIRWPWDATKPSPEDRLDHAYESPQSSRWRVTVKEGENLLTPVEITGAKVRQKPNPRARVMEP